VTNASTRGNAAADNFVATVPVSRTFMLNPNAGISAAQLRAVAAASIPDDPGASPAGNTVSWRWPLDLGLRTTEAVHSYWDCPQVARSPEASITTVWHGEPYFGVVVALTPSGWSISPSTTNIAKYPSANIGTPGITTATSVAYESLPQGVVHAWVGWTDSSGSYQKAYFRLDVFTEDQNARSMALMLFGSKGQGMWTGTGGAATTAQAAYNDAYERHLTPCVLRNASFGSTTASTALSQGTAGSTVATACGFATIRLLYEGPENNLAAASSSQFNAVTAKVQLLSLAELNHLFVTEYQLCAPLQREKPCITEPLGEPGTRFPPSAGSYYGVTGAAPPSAPFNVPSVSFEAEGPQVDGSCEACEVINTGGDDPGSDPGGDDVVGQEVQPVHEVSESGTIYQSGEYETPGLEPLQTVSTRSGFSWAATAPGGGGGGKGGR